MKYTWEEKDIESGLTIIRNSAPRESNNLNFMRTVTYKLGYNGGLIDGGKFVKISILTDGYVSKGKTKSELCDDFNNDEYGYRPANKKEIIDMINSSNQGFYF